ncbi:hypothetical protein L4D76_18935 [Photobacterium sagamiensis]|uniref:hypothetical protein n=1 Tax=Photobacterium sagamiensis TaxID=2910241 RepID=UPI003D126780
MIKYSDLQSADIADALGESFDFELCRANDDSSWIKLDPNLPFTVLAGEGSGGVFLAYGNLELEKRPILFASSEGQAGKVANNLPEFLALLMAIPYWFDLLKFSGNGDLSEMRKTALFMEPKYCEDYPESSEARELIQSHLALPEIEDPIAVLHACVNSTDCTVVADDGWKYETLFNSFVSSDNKSWS